MNDEKRKLVRRMVRVLILSIQQGGKTEDIEELLVDAICDAGVNQIVNTNGWNTSLERPKENSNVVIFKQLSACQAQYINGEYIVYNYRAGKHEPREGIEYWIYAPAVTNGALQCNENA